MSIGSLITGWFEDRVEDWRDRLFGWTSGVIRAGFEFFFGGLEDLLIPDMRASIERLKQDPNTPAEARPVLDRLGDDSHPIAGILLIPLAVVMLIPMLGAVFQPFVRLMYYEQERVAKSARMDPQNATFGYFRDRDNAGKYESDLRDTGWTDNDIEAFRNIFKPLLTKDEIRQLTLRLGDPDGALRRELEKAGYSDRDIEALQELYRTIPPLADMVRFADFSAFDPAVIERWREFYDAPGWIKEPFSLLGITGEWADRYWFSHWRQPGRFELGELHRRFLIEDGDARLAYQTQGYSAYWQDLLLKLVEEPLTRVDVRRMHDVGLLTDEELSAAYHAVGFYGENNERMVEFTKRYNAGTQRSVTESKILKAYRNGDIGREVALDLLQEIGYTEDDADFVLATEEDDQVETKRDLTRTQVRDLYFAGINDRLETTDRLAAMGYDAEAIADLMDLWDLEQRAAVRTPTRTELTHFLGEGIITVDTFRSRMAAEGYQPEHIDWYLQEHEADQVAAARREEERARAEQERVAAAADRTAYQEARARLDVDIATLRTYIAEKRLAIRQTDDDALEQDLREDIDRAQVAIAELREQKARLKLS